jgi:tetratricopeptide (TPR) repeat protein
MKYLLCFVVALSAVIPAFAGRNYDIGIRYYSAKNYDKAREALLKEVVEVPSNGNAYYFLGEVEKAAGRFSDSENYYRKAVQTQIQRKYLSLAYWNLLVLIEQRNDIGELIKVCQEFNRRTGDGSARRKIDDIINKLIWSDSEDAIRTYKEGLSLKESGKKEDARGKFFDALKIDPSFLAPHFELGIMYYGEGKNSDAISHLRSVGDRIPYYSAVHLLLGDLYYATRSYQQSVAEFDLALEYGFFDKDTRFATLVKSGSSHYNLRNYDKASAQITEALEISPNDKDCLMLLSAIDIKTENYDAALATLTKLHSVTPNDNDVLLQIGSLYYRQNKTDKAAGYFETIFGNTTKNGGQISEKYHKAMVILFKYYYDKKEYSKSSRIASVLPQSAFDFDANLTAARSYFHNREYQKAADIYERLTIGDDDRMNLARCYVKIGDKSRAKSLLQSVIKYSQQMRSKALSDSILSSLAKEIQQDEQRAAATPVPVMPASTPKSAASPASSVPSAPAPTPAHP